jgi:hypothetical protein
MKKLFFAIYTISLVVLAPAIFAGYLHSDNKTTVAHTEVKTVKPVITAEAQEAGYTAALLIATR